jgi:hypothetical protein
MVIATILPWIFPSFWGYKFAASLEMNAEATSALITLRLGRVYIFDLVKHLLPPVAGLARFPWPAHLECFPIPVQPLTICTALWRVVDVLGDPFMLAG